MFLLFLFLETSSSPKRSRFPPTPTASINTLPSVITGSIVLPIIIIASIFASISFFLHQKRTTNDSPLQVMQEQEDNVHLLAANGKEEEEKNEKSEKKEINSERLNLNSGFPNQSTMSVIIMNDSDSDISLRSIPED